MSAHVASLFDVPEQVRKTDFGEYVRWVRAHDAEAPIPPLFADEALFLDARGMADQLGDERHDAR